MYIAKHIISIILSLLVGVIIAYFGVSAAMESHSAHAVPFAMFVVFIALIPLVISILIWTVESRK